MVVVEVVRLEEVHYLEVEEERRETRPQLQVVPLYMEEMEEEQMETTKLVQMVQSPVAELVVVELILI
jgi:hypothetical protein